MDLFKVSGKCFEKDLSFQMSQKTITAHQNITNMRSLGEFDATVHMCRWLIQPFLQ